ncbi:unnamed protein product [Coccothraustes coccothraustes]
MEGSGASPRERGGKGNAPRGSGDRRGAEAGEGLGTKLKREGPRTGSSARASGALPAAPERPTAPPPRPGGERGLPQGSAGIIPTGWRPLRKRLLPLRAPRRRGKDPPSAAARPPALPARRLRGAEAEPRTHLAPRSVPSRSSRRRSSAPAAAAFAG